MKVMVGSGNPVKRGATEDAFREVFGSEVRVEGAEVDSGVPDQPMGGQTWEGARNRARALLDLPQAHDAQYAVGIEGGIERVAGCWFAFGAMCVRHRDGREGIGGSPRFRLPERVMAGIEAGRELGDVMDEITGESGTKRRGGAIDFLTAGTVDRRRLYRSGLLMALAPFARPEAFKDESARPRVEGVVETALYVADLERSERFYRELFDSEVLFSDERMSALTIGTEQVLLLFRRGASAEASEIPGGTIPGHDGRGQLHVAFGIERQAVDSWLRKMNQAGIELESRVDWPRGGVSLYFRDPDEHAIELVTRGCWSVY